MRISESESAALVAAATEVAARAYCPFSGYAVGAAVLSSEGGIYLGCNVENASYGATLCAERAAVCTMVAAGSRELKAVAVFTKDGAPPCGMCLQVLAEFASKEGETAVLLASPNHVAQTSLSKLFPAPFNLKAGERW